MKFRQWILQPPTTEPQSNSCKLVGIVVTQLSPYLSVYIYNIYIYIYQNYFVIVCLINSCKKNCGGVICLCSMLPLHNPGFVPKLTAWLLNGTPETHQGGLESGFAWLTRNSHPKYQKFRHPTRLSLSAMTQLKALIVHHRLHQASSLTGKHKKVRDQHLMIFLKKWPLMQP